MRKLFTLITLSVIPFILFAQGEANNWCFGGFAGISFNSGAPVGFTGSAINQNEGVASISNGAGQLLFYTDGIRVWNRLHQQMPNGFGLMGNPSSTQSAVVVPFIGVPNMYYVFTVANNAGANGFRYSIVDMNLQGGLGDVTTKNILLLTPTSEKVTATAHANGYDVWVVTHHWGTDSFYSYLVTSAGVSNTPVISSVGQSHSGNNSGSVGYMKISPDGNKLGLAIDHTLKCIELFDFDKATGQLTNAVVDFGPFPGLGPYGVEFSPDSRLFYVGQEGSNVQLHQYNLQAVGPAIVSTKQIVATGMPNTGSLQLAPDGKIYMTATGTNYLSVINNPNAIGTACNYVQGAFTLLPGQTARFGLPNFIQTFFFFTNDFSYIDTCQGNNTLFTSNINNTDSLKWDFGDLSSGVLNTASGDSVYHIFTQPGTYGVTLYSYLNNLIDTSFRVVNINMIPMPDLGNDTTICAGQSILLDVTIPGGSYSWSSGETTPVITASQADLITVAVSLQGCTGYDTISLAVLTTPTLNLPDTDTLCQGETLILDAGFAGASYLWNDNSTNATLSVTNTGVYSVTSTIGSCSVADSSNIVFVLTPVVELGNDTTICTGETLHLSATNQGSVYVWNTTAITDTISVVLPGTYSVTVNSNGCMADDTIVLTVQSAPTLNLPDTDTLCQGETLILDASFAGASYLWNDNSTNATLSVTTSGTYSVTSSIGNCSVSDTSNVVFITMPVVALGNDTIICTGDSVQLSAFNTGSTYLWSTTETTSSITVTQSGQYNVTVNRNGCITTDDIIVNAVTAPTLNLPETDTLCQGQTKLLDATYPSADYLWNDGSTNATLSITTSGTYSVTSSIGNCSVADTSSILFIPMPVVQLGNDTTICSGASVYLTAFNTGSTYLWSTGETTGTISVTQQNQYTVTVSTSGCNTADTVNVNVQLPPIIMLPASDTVCEGETLLLDAFYPLATYLWNTGATTSGINVTTAGTYSVTSTIGPCTVAGNTIVYLTPLPQVNLGADTLYCPGTSVLLNAGNPGANYLWSTTEQTQQITISNEGSYTATVTVNGCSSSDSINFTDFIPVTELLGTDTSICPGGSIVLVPQAGANPVWQDGATTPQYTATAQGVYSVTVQQLCGPVSDDVFITEDTCECIVVMPNAFTANSDKINDEFKPISNCALSKVSFRIYNRWGELVFETNQPNTGWNGTFKNEAQAAGAYFWYLDYYDIFNNNMVTKTGSVTLLR